MKHIHLAGLALALSAFAAHAQQAGAVSIGGILDGGLRRDSGTTTGAVNSVNSGQSLPSRINFSGYEDLGGGMKAGFVLESGIALDSGVGVSNPPGVASGPMTFGRTASIALGGDSMGYLSLGRQYTPLWAVTAGPASDPFGASWLGGVGTVASATVRASNAIVYSYGYTYRTMLRPAPMQGLGGALMYAPGEATTATSTHAGDQFGFNVSYGTPQFFAGYGFHQVRGSSPSISPTAAVSDQPRLKQQTLATSYAIGVVRLHAVVNKAENGLAGAGAVDRLNWAIGSTVTLGTDSLLVLFGKADDRTALNADFKTLQVGYQHNLSKRTSLYAGVGQVSNSDAAAVSLLGSNGTYAAGSRPRSIIGGVKHVF